MMPQNQWQHNLYFTGLVLYLSTIVDKVWAEEMNVM
jgi:hypothetical protein